MKIASIRCLGLWVTQYSHPLRSRVQRLHHQHLLDDLDE